ncbi:hypothetical protein Scep_025203 [Stephania cephalantha]|uniref:Uncharacterized protein n=1 Tax=Stephania cephalantha TaxID=152367 RepID=A0AAP0HP26_9MAGN
MITVFLLVNNYAEARIIKAYSKQERAIENVDNAIAGHYRRDHLGIGRDRRLNFLTDPINKAGESLTYQLFGKLRDDQFRNPIGDFINQTGTTVAGKAKEFFHNVGSGAKDFFQNVGGQVVNGAKKVVTAFGGSKGSRLANSISNGNVDLDHGLVSCGEYVYPMSH